MPGRGGRRGGAGRKGTWQNGETGTIRVPVALKDRILDLGQQLDRGQEILNSDVRVSLHEILGEWEAKCQGNDAPEWQPVRQLLAQIQAVLSQERMYGRGHGRGKGHCAGSRHSGSDSSC